MQYNAHDTIQDCLDNECPVPARAEENHRSRKSQPSQVSTWQWPLLLNTVLYLRTSSQWQGALSFSSLYSLTLRKYNHPIELNGRVNTVAASNTLLDIQQLGVATVLEDYNTFISGLISKPY